MKIIINFMLAICLFAYSCDRCNEDCNRGALQFDLQLNAYGIKDTLYLGDTLRLKLDIPDKLPERFTGYKYEFNDYNFQLITYIVRTDTLPLGLNSQETFDWITLTGESEYVGDVFLVHPAYDNSTYQYEVLILPKKKGLFVFGMNNVATRINPLKKLNGQCSNLPVEVFMKLENDTNTNFEFLKLSPDASQANIDRQRFDEFAGFCFFVR